MLAYATTIHKSQGSEYPAVVIPLSTQRYPMLQRNLVYTGVTRGKRLVVLLGQRKALAIAVRGARTRRRWSKLGEWLGRAATTLMRCAGCNPGQVACGGPAVRISFAPPKGNLQSRVGVAHDRLQSRGLTGCGAGQDRHASDSVDRIHAAKTGSRSTSSCNRNFETICARAIDSVVRNVSIVSRFSASFGVPACRADENVPAGRHRAPSSRDIWRGRNLRTSDRCANRFPRWRPDSRDCVAEKSGPALRRGGRIAGGAASARGLCAIGVSHPGWQTDACIEPI